MLTASNVAFDVAFGIFLVALAVLFVVVLTWAIRRDRQGRAAFWQRRVQDLERRRQEDLERRSQEEAPSEEPSRDGSSAEAP